MILQRQVSSRLRHQFRSLSTKKRKIVRDPRRGSKQTQTLAKIAEHEEHMNQLSHQHQQSPLPFEPNQANQQSIGSSMGAYALAGAGMALGFTIVGLIFG